MANEYILAHQYRRSWQKEEEKLRRILLDYFTRAGVRGIRTNLGEVHYQTAVRYEYDVAGLKAALPELVFAAITRPVVEEDAVERLIKDGILAEEVVEQNRRPVATHRLVAQLSADPQKTGAKAIPVPPARREPDPAG